VLRRLRPLVALLVVALLGAAAASVSLSSLSSPARPVTEDRNGDGRPDVWRTYDREGRLSEVAIDSNFDGRSDVHEYYEKGTLISRESDRNFDDRIDLVQQFDATSHDQVRAIEDVDYDGTADLLVLFQEGRPVFSKWAVHREAPVLATASAARTPEIARRAGDDPLTALADPFQSDLAMAAVRLAGGLRDSLGTTTSARLPAIDLEAADRRAAPFRGEPADQRYLPSAILDPHSPRGPPAARS
jgi:hypothetical protein